MARPILPAQSNSSLISSALSQQLIVTLEPSAAQHGFLRAIEAISGRFEKILLGRNEILSKDGSIILTISIPDGVDIENALKFIHKHADVQLAEVDSTVSISLESVDALYSNGQLWGMSGATNSGTGLYETTYGARADAAWANVSVARDGHIGSMATVVGIVDTGIDPLHPDLYQNIWINQNEIPNTATVDFDADGIITFRDLNARTAWGSFLNPVKDINGNGYIDADDILRDPKWADGIDTDQNGFIDDFFGWDFLDNDNRPFEAYLGYNGLTGSNPSNSYHGTHVAGTIGAMANDSGVVGVSWDVQLMPLRFIGEDGFGKVSDAISAVNYYSTLGASHPSLNFVATNNSWGGAGSSQTLSEVIQNAGNQGHLFVAAAGNAGQNNDSINNFPSNFEITSNYNGKFFDPVIAIASIDGDGSLSSFSNYGMQTVDLGAPGQSIASTLAGTASFGKYGYINANGTSMATPHVTGALALLSGEFPEWAPDQLRSELLSATTPTASLDGKTVTGGRLDIGAMFRTNTAPVGDVMINGDLAQGSMLIADVSGISDLDGIDETSFKYQWLRDTQVIAGATTSFYIPTLADVGHMLSVDLSYIDGLGTIERISSRATAPIEGLNMAPVAYDDAATTVKDIPITIDVLANDTDAEQDTLTVTDLVATQGGTVSINLDGTIF